MSRIKDHFHDEIVAAFDADDEARSAAESESESPLPIPLPPVHVLMERNEVTGDVRPVQIYTVLSDAQDDLRLLKLGRRVFKLPEHQTHYLVEGVACL